VNEGFQDWDFDIRQGIQNGTARVTGNPAGSERKCGAASCESNTTHTVTSTLSKDKKTFTVKDRAATTWSGKNRHGKVIANGVIIKTTTVTISDKGETSYTQSYEAAAYKWSERFQDMVSDPAHSQHYETTKSIPESEAYHALGETVQGGDIEAVARGHQLVVNALFKNSLEIMADYINLLHDHVVVLERREQAMRWWHIAEAFSHMW
jgi:hypothetical protein